MPETSSLLWTLLSDSAGHLWQSTVCLLAAAVLVLLLRRYSARVRYAIWLAASLKFLLPFSAITRLGSVLAPPSPAPPVFPSRLEIVFEAVGVGSGPVAASAAWHGSAQTPSAVHHSLALLIPICTAVWAVGALIVLGMFCRRWLQAYGVRRAATPLCSGREVQILRALEQARDLQRPVELRLTEAAIEPSVFGIFRPVLLWPAGISAHLDDTHVEAILAHELAHMERRDNLAAAMHLLVQAIFWFHPLVWWLGARLLAEREHACDEAVLAAGSTPEIYAEGLLRTCRFCIAFAIPCAAGVTGGELRERVRGIMGHSAVRRLNAAGKWILSAVAIGMVAVPFCFGLTHPAPVRLPFAVQVAPPPPPPPPAQHDEQGANQPGTPPAKVPEFAVASVKPDKSGTMMVRIMFEADGFSATNASLKQLIQLTFDIHDGSRITGAPSWIDHANYDIEAKVDGADLPVMKNLTVDQRRQMIRKLLEDRFALKVHEETKEVPVYALVVAKGGPKLHEAKPGDTYANGIKGPDGKAHAGLMMFNGKQLTAQGVPVSNLAQFLVRWTDRTVIDQTGLTGKYDITLDLPAMQKPPGMQKPPDDSAAGSDGAPEDSGPSIFTIVQDELGLKLEPTKAQLPIVIIDHVEQPSEN